MKKRKPTPVSKLAPGDVVLVEWHDHAGHKNVREDEPADIFIFREPGIVDAVYRNRLVTFSCTIHHPPDQLHGNHCSKETYARGSIAKVWRWGNVNECA